MRPCVCVCVCVCVCHAHRTEVWVIRVRLKYQVEAGSDYKQTIQIKLRWALFVTYTIIQSIMRSEMCSLHLTHPSRAVGSRHCGARGAVGGSVPCSRVSPQSWTSCQSRDSNSQPWVTSGFKSNALSIRPDCPTGCKKCLVYNWFYCFMSLHRDTASQYGKGHNISVSCWAL